MDTSPSLVFQPSAAAPIGWANAKKVLCGKIHALPLSIQIQFQTGDEFLNERIPNTKKKWKRYRLKENPSLIFSCPSHVLDVTTSIPVEGQCFTWLVYSTHFLGAALNMRRECMIWCSPWCCVFQITSATERIISVSAVI